MPVLRSQIDLHSDEYQFNYSQQKKMNDLLKKNQDLFTSLPESAIQKQKDNNTLTVRQRIDKIIDDNSAFLEFSSLAAWEMYDKNARSAGIVTGIGCIHKQPCVIIANDSTVKGGSYYPMTVKKHLRAQEIAFENGLPCLYLVDSGGAFLPLQSEVFPDRDHFGRIFYNQAQMSAAGIPQIAIVFGSCTAGGAYLPAMSDENIIIKNQGTIFLGGPPLVKAATGEDVTAEELGGAEVHCSKSGVCDHFVENEFEAIEKAREIFIYLNRDQKQKINTQPIREPLYDPDELYGIVSADPKIPYDAKEVIARLVDGSEFHEFKQNYGSTLVTGFASIWGYPVGIVANNGVLFSESALKGSHFIDLCDQRNIPLVFLQNVTGFMVGKSYENSGIAKNGAKMVTSVSNCRVPKFTVIIGGSYGAGNYGMCGRAFQPRQLWMWPNARISVMGGQQAAQVLLTVKTEQLQKQGCELSPKEQENLIQPILEKYEKESSAYYSTARLWDDGIIDPINTRKILSLGINASLYKAWPNQSKGIYRM